LLKKEKDSRGARPRPFRRAGAAVLTSSELQGLQDHSESLILASQRLYSILDRQTLGIALCEEVCQLLGAHTAAVLCVDEGKWDIRAALATAGGELAGRSVLGQCAPIFFHLGQTVLKTNVLESADLEFGPALLGPMRTRKGDGALVAVFPAETGFTDELRALMVAICSIGSLAYGNAQLHTQLQEQTVELQQLLDVCAELAKTADFERFLETFVVRATSFLGFERSFIALTDGTNLEIKYGADEGIGRHFRMRITSPLTLDLLKRRKSVVTEDATKEAGADPDAVMMFSVKQYLGVPIYAADSPAFGVLGMLDRINGEPITPDIIRKAETLAGNVAVALQSLHTLQIAQENKHKAENRVGLAMEMGSSLSLSELLRTLGQRASKMLSARGVAVGLCHEATKATLIEGVYFEDTRTQNRDPRLFGEAMSEYAATHSQPIYFGRAEKILSGKLTAFGWNEVLIARLFGAGGELLGFLCLADCASAPDESSLALLNALVGHASIALENARLFSRIAQSNKQWAELFDSISDYIVVHDEEHLITRVNRPFAEFMKVRPQDLVGMHMRRVMGNGAQVGQQPCPLCVRETADEFVYPGNGRTYLLSTVKAPWHSGVQAIHVLKDMTDRREAERRYQELFNTVQEGVYFATPVGRFVDVNEALVRMLGYTNKEELMRLDIETDFYVRQEEREAVVASLRANDRSSREVVLRRKNGAPLYALENSVAVRDERGWIVQYRGLVLDITESKSFQTQLQRQRDFNTQILNNTQSMILVSDTAGLVSYANKRCFEAGLYATTELLGQPLEKFVAEADLASWRKAFEKALGGSPVDNLELQLRRGDGNSGRFSINMSPMRGDKDLVNSVVIVMTDITELSNMQSKLMHTEKMVAVGQLVSGVAHEVNNPLTAIMGFTDLMLENPEVPAPFRRDLEVILREADRTKQIVQNLLSFARQMPKQRNPVDVHDVIRRTIQLRAYDFSVHGVEVVERFALEIRPVLGDGHQLQQVFLNILNNAYDAISETGRKGRIEIETRNAADGIEIHFRDNGPGVTHPERIFDPFFTTKDVGKGTGLGLSICYGIIRQHSGDISCRNHPSGGAIFVIRLPYFADWAIESVRAAGASA
jgi:two-component system NtrC family sensor kinase